MLNAKPTQLELFNSGVDALTCKKKAQGAFFEKINAYEKNIILAVLFVILFIIAYSLGIERGKKTITLDSPQITQIGALAQSAPLKAKTVNQKNNLRETIKKTPDNKTLTERNNNTPIFYKEVTQKGYAVQVASFKKESSAQKEKMILEKKGYRAIVLPKKDFLVVYTGIFKDEIEAKNNQKKLRKYYNDCVVRKI